MRIQLTPEHKVHLRQIGHPTPPNEVEVAEAEYLEHKANWRKTLPHADEDTLHKKAIAHIAWSQYHKPVTLSPLTARLALEPIALWLKIIAALLAAVLATAVNSQVHWLGR